MAVQERSPAAPASPRVAVAWRPPVGAALAAVLLGALALRLWGIDYGLPYAYHPDEPFMIGVPASLPSALAAG